MTFSKWPRRRTSEEAGSGGGREGAMGEDEAGSVISIQTISVV